MKRSIFHDGDEGVRLIVKDPNPKRPGKAAAGPVRAPVHVVYGGADRFTADTPGKLGAIALRAFEENASNFVELAAALRLPDTGSLPDYPQAVNKLERQIAKDPERAKAELFPAWFAWTIYSRTVQKLRSEPVEDFRIDFEDGYGFRRDAEEDADAERTASELARSFNEGTITAFSGFRIKSFAPETYGRAVRTLQLFLDTLLRHTGGRAPNNFVVCLPKITDKKQVKDLCRRIRQFEKKAGLKNGSIGVELMVETPEAILGNDGRIVLREIVESGKGRVASVHFGAFDYTSALGIVAEHQHLRHPACDFARQMMLLSLAPLGVRLSDSVTTRLPVPIHKGSSMLEIQHIENRRAIHAGWLEHFRNVSHSMETGFYQSWDLHPNQLVARFAAVFAFFLTGLDAQAARLRNYVENATKAGTTENVFDDAATAQGVLNFFCKGIACGAFSAEEAATSTGLEVELFRTGSFDSIVASIDRS
jgi:citrate lyase beta subunit